MRPSGSSRKTKSSSQAWRRSNLRRYCGSPSQCDRQKVLPITFKAECFFSSSSLPSFLNASYRLRPRWICGSNPTDMGNSPSGASLRYSSVGFFLGGWASMTKLNVLRLRFFFFFYILHAKCLHYNIFQVFLPLSSVKTSGSKTFPTSKCSVWREEKTRVGHFSKVKTTREFCREGFLVLLC